MTCATTPRLLKDSIWGKMHVSRESRSGLSCWAVWHWAWLQWSLCFLSLLYANLLKWCHGCLRYFPLSTCSFGISIRKTQVYLFYCVTDKNYRKYYRNLMSHPMLGTVSVALLNENLFLNYGMLLRVPISGQGDQPHCFSYFFNIFPSEQSYQSFTCAVLRTTFHVVHGGSLWTLCSYSSP